MAIVHLLPFALPHGRTNNVGQLTVYFSPRLKEAGRLLRYPTFLDWPAFLATRNLRVQVNGVDANPRPVGVSASSSVWRAVFDRETPVKAHRFVDFSTTPVLPMASSDFSEDVLELYLSLARLHPDGPPTGTGLLALARAAGLNLDPAAGETGSLSEAAAYRAPMVDAVDPDASVAAPEFDFHASVSLLGHHPELLRHLGLAVDLEIDLPANPTEVRASINGFGAAGFGPGGDTTEVALITHTTRDFWAEPSPTDPEQAGGFLTLAAEKAFLSIVDPHLAASRLAAAAKQAAPPTEVEGRDDGTLPALATRALTLVRPDLSNAYANRFVRQAELEEDLRANLGGGAAVRLQAEDLTIGHRIDVLDQGRWRSLFERQSADGYRWPLVETVPTIKPAPDEGWNTTLLVTEQADERIPDGEDREVPTALFRLDDAMYRWNGWSGAAPPVGSVLDSATGTAVPVKPSEPVADQTVQLCVDYQVVPGSLPRLRFGRTYQMRARCVDLAGDSRPRTAVEGKDAVAPAETFGRLEPVAAPTVARRSPRPTPGVGDTPYEIVLRSDAGTKDTDVVPVDRLLFPGRVGQDLCELHGLPSGGADPGSYAELAARDRLDLSDQTVVDPVTGETVAAVSGKAGLEPGPTRQEVSYLSDPAISGVRFGFTGRGTEATVPVAKTWPARPTVRLLVAAGSGGVQIRPDDQTDLRVAVPQAEIVTVDASFTIDPTLLEHFALWQRLTAGERALLGAKVLGGAHWMFTPSRSLRLVHAVRRPLLVPSVSALSAERAVGSSAVTFGVGSELVVHRNSTERVSMTAAWTDTIDDPIAGPVPRTTRVELGNVPVTRGAANTLLIAGLTSQLHDTKRHQAQISLEAYSSFASYFTEQRTLVVVAPPVLLDRRGVVPGSVEVTVPATGVKGRLGVDFTVNAAAGEVDFAGRGALPVGTPVTVRFVAQPISRTSAESSAAPFEVVFANTVTPPPPVVADVIPAFARSTAGSHSGQVLRVYLSRPWLVTGDGEQLAVVLGPGQTVVGRDPIVPGSEPGRAVTAADFPRLAGAVPTIGRVEVVPHAVQFDAVSGRWFADIELASDFGYRPFLRLVVARFQPDSVAGAELSSFVTLDPVRLGVVRKTAVAASGDSISVEVVGADELGNQVQVRLQVADPTIKDLDLRWQPVADPVRLVRSDSLWSGTLARPAGSDPVRVVIEELEPGRPAPTETVVFVEAVELQP